MQENQPGVCVSLRLCVSASRFAEGVHCGSETLGDRSIRASLGWVGLKDGLKDSCCCSSPANRDGRVLELFEGPDGPQKGSQLGIR